MSNALSEGLKRFDAAADAALEPVRSHAWTRAVFRGASHAADFSVLWVVIGIVHGGFVANDLSQTLWFSALILFESIVVNQGIKRLFRRTRPTETGDERLKVRKPRSSSFPSGHASAAFFSGTLLSAWVGWWSIAIWIVPVLIVATSRAVVRIHHASDVIAGAAVGLGLAGVVLLTPVVDFLRN